MEIYVFTQLMLLDMIILAISMFRQSNEFSSAVRLQNYLVHCMFIASIRVAFPDLTETH